jgi:hypothetical protein
MPPGWYAAGWDKVEQALRLNRPPRIDVPADIRDYYTRLYHSGDLDEHEVGPKRGSFQFASVAQAYRLIDDPGQPVVVTTWQERAREVRTLLDQLRNPATRKKAVFRALGRFQVNVRPGELRNLPGVVVPVPDTDVFEWAGGYDPEVGLLVDELPELAVV